MSGRRSHRVPLQSLGTLLSASTDFMLRFIAADGVAALVEFFNNRLLEELLVTENLGLKNLYFEMAAFLKAVEPLVDRAGKVVVLTPQAVNTVALCLAEAVSEDAFRIMDKLNAVSPDAVYDALRHYQRVFGTSFRFGVLIGAFDIDHLPIKTHAFRIINRLIAECVELEERFDLRNEIMRAGMSEIMADSSGKHRTPPDFALLVAEFEESADNDFVLMIERHGEADVMARLESFMAEADDLGDDLLRVSVYEGTTLHGTTNISYNGGTSEAEIRKALLDKFDFAERKAVTTKSYGLLVDHKYRGKKQFWLEPGKTCGDYTLEGEIRCQFKMKPWPLYIQ